jgi:TATA-binding protein-associated factor Taf7
MMEIKENKEVLETMARELAEMEKRIRLMRQAVDAARRPVGKKREPARKVTIRVGNKEVQI